jgi:Lrp/AsnC family leucine-responsive transcriptional regulator
MGKKIDKMDECALNILRVLQKDARAGVVTIAEKLKTSPATVQRRIKELEAAGYILGYTVLLDREKLGYKEVVTTLVQLNKHHPDDTDEFERLLTELFPNVLQWSKLQGSWDYLLTFIVRDTVEYEQLHRQLMRLPVVERSRGQVPLKVGATRPFPLDLIDIDDLDLNGS